MTRVAIYLIWAAAVVMLGAGIGWLLARQHYEPLLADLQARNGALTTSNQGLQASIERTNKAVSDLEAQGRQRAEDAAKAIAAARSQSAKDHARANAVLAEAKPAELSECEAAQSAFAAELRGERGAP